MPRISAYLPEDLYRRAKARGLNVSAVLQRELRREIEARAAREAFEAEQIRQYHLEHPDVR